jgi:hypothetical protein
MEIRRRFTKAHLGPTLLPATIPSSTVVRLTHQQLSLRHREPWRPGMALLHSRHTESPRSRCLLRADKQLGTPDKRWKHNLHGLFEYCIIDEAQSIKNPDSYSHLAMLWLDARFNALATITPDINNVVCIEGYAHFIQSSDDLWTPDKLTELNFGRFLPGLHDQTQHWHDHDRA